MKNNCLIVLSSYAPSLKHGGGIANLSSLKVYSKYYRHVYYIYFGNDELEFIRELDNITFYIIDMNNQMKWLRFLLGFIYRVPAVCVSFRKRAIRCKLESLIEEILQSDKLDQGIHVIFEDLQVACFLPSLKIKYPHWRFAVRSHNVLANIFFAFTISDNYNVLFRFLMKIECSRNYTYEKKILLLADKVWAISEEDRRQYKKLFGLTCDGVFSIDYSNPGFNKIESEDLFTLLYLGGIDLRKKSGMNSFIDCSWKIIKKRFPTVKLLLGGRNTELFHDPSKGIYGLGYIEDEIAFLRKGFIFINTQTVGSGVKLKSIVAILAGKLLISTKIGIEGVLGEDGKHYLVANNWTDFANKIIYSLENLEESMAVAKAGQRYIQTNYCFEHLYETTSQLLFDLNG